MSNEAKTAGHDQLDAPAGEPSMDEILASIRRILSDEEAPAATPAAPTVPAPAAAPPAAVGEAGGDEDEEDVIPLSATMLVQEPETPPAPEQPSPVEFTPSFAMTSAFLAEPPAPPAPAPAPPPPVAPVSTQVAAAPAPPEPAAPPAAQPEEAAMPDGTAEDVLVSATAAAAALTSLGAISALARSSNESQGLVMGNVTQTLEEMIRQEIRPLLKEWLDENLAPLVERMVKREIERLTAEMRQN